MDDSKYVAVSSSISPAQLFLCLQPHSRTRQKELIGDIAEDVQRRAIKLIPTLQDLLYSEDCKTLSLSYLQDWSWHSHNKIPCLPSPYEQRGSEGGTVLLTKISLLWLKLLLKESEFIKITECYIRVADCFIRVFRSFTKIFCISKVISNLNYIPMREGKVVCRRVTGNKVLIDVGLSY